jgi:hypothetical protein
MQYQSNMQWSVRLSCRQLQQQQQLAHSEDMRHNKFHQSIRQHCGRNRRVEQPIWKYHRSLQSADRIQAWSTHRPPCIALRAALQRFQKTMETTRVLEPCTTPCKFMVVALQDQGTSNKTNENNGADNISSESNAVGLRLNTWLTNKITRLYTS